jgi:hypothetical protein
MVILLTVVVGLNVILWGLLALRLGRLEIEIDGARSDLTAIRRYLIAPNVGGRPAPTPAELTAAKNRIDAQGIAHPGGP